MDSKLSETIQYERLCLFIKDQQSSIQALHCMNWCQFTTQHLGALFQAALRMFGMKSCFNLVKAMRLAFPVALGLHHHLTYFWEISLQGGCLINTLAWVVASTLLIDHYVPGMMCMSPGFFQCALNEKRENQQSKFIPLANYLLVLEPWVIFRTLYCASLMKSCQAYKRVATDGKQKSVNKETSVSENFQLPGLLIKGIIGLVE
jgi:hypothetical protein